MGEDPADPVFTVLDLLPHLARKSQMDKKVTDAFEGEKLNVLVGSLPLGDKETKDRFKLHLLKHLEDRYGIREEDLISAELEIVPAGSGPGPGLGPQLWWAGTARTTAPAPMPRLGRPSWILRTRNTLPGLFYDKEEIGTDGNTSAKSCLLEEIVELLLERAGESPQVRRRALMASRAISADVTGALDPD